MKMHDVFHVSQKPYNQEGTYLPPPVTILLEGEEEFEVATIVNHREQPGKRSWSAGLGMDQNMKPGKLRAICRIAVIKSKHTGIS